MTSEEVPSPRTILSTVLVNFAKWEAKPPYFSSFPRSVVWDLREAGGVINTPGISSHLPLCIAQCSRRLVPHQLANGIFKQRVGTLRWVLAQANGTGQFVPPASAFIPFPAAIGVSGGNGSLRRCEVRLKNKTFVAAQHWFHIGTVLLRLHKRDRRPQVRSLRVHRSRAESLHNLKDILLYAIN